MKRLGCFRRGSYASAKVAGGRVGDPLPGGSMGAPKTPVSEATLGRGATSDP